MKNKLLTLSLLLTLSFTLTGCSLSDLPVIGKFFGEKVVPAKEVTLTMWGLWENPAVMATMIEKYRETNPNVTINYEDRSVIESGAYKDRVFARIGQSSVPDLVATHASWVPRLVKDLSAAPSTLISTQDYQQKFYPSATDNAVFQGKVYAVPLYYDGLILVYNRKHFEEVGQLSPPTGWKEFRDLAVNLTVRGDGGSIVRAGAAMGTADNNDFFSDILGLVFSQAGISIPNDLDTKNAKDALEFYTNFATEDRVWNDSFLEASTAFAKEKVSMIFVPTWSILDIIYSRKDMDIGVAPVPQALPDSPVSWSSYWMYVVPSASENSAVAWDFLNFLVQEEQQLMLFNEASKYRQYGAPYSLVSLASQVSTNPYLSPALDTAGYGKMYEITGRSGNNRRVDILRNAVNAILVGKRKNEPVEISEVLRTVKQELIRAQ